jgi:hypothetical protein
MTRSAAARLFCFAAGALLAGLGSAQDAELRRYRLPNHDTLELRLPVSWTDHFEQPAGGGPPTIEIAVVPDGAPQVFIRPEWDDPTTMEVRELPQLRDAVRDLAERTRPDAVESFLEVRDLAGANGVGYYFSATERSPRADGFKYMSQGALQVGRLTLWFTILTNDGQDTVAVEALAMLQAAVHRRTGHDQL